VENWIKEPLAMNDSNNDALSRRNAVRLLGGAAALAATGATGIASAIAAPPDDTYSPGEIRGVVADFFGMTTTAVAATVERVFADNGRPNAYIKGEEASAAVIVGGTLGKGSLFRKRRPPFQVYWQGPSLGFDLGGNASKVVCLIYNLGPDNEIFQSFAGVGGSYYFIAGIGVNYHQEGRIKLAPMRTGLGARAGVNVGTMSITRERSFNPF
jgi:hypothetical protein